MLNKFYSKLKFIILPMLITLTGLCFLSMVFNLITVNNAMVGFYLTFADLVIMAVLVFGIVAHCKDNKEWFTIFAIILFANSFTTMARGLFSSLVLSPNAHGLTITVGVFDFLANLALTIVGVLVVLLKIINKPKFQKIAKEIVNWCVTAFFLIVFISFVLITVSAFIDGTGVIWAEIPAPLFNFALGGLFIILFNADRNGNKSVQEENVEEETDGQVEEDNQEAPSEENAEEKSDKQEVTEDVVEENADTYVYDERDFPSQEEIDGNAVNYEENENPETRKKNGLKLFMEKRKKQ